MIKFLALTVLCSALVLPLQAEALKSVYDSRNYSANIATKVQMIEQVKNSAQQLKYDLQNLQKLDPSNLERSYYRIANAIRMSCAKENKTKRGKESVRWSSCGRVCCPSPGSRR